MGTQAGIPPWNPPPPPRGTAWRAMPESPQSAPWAGGRGGRGGSLQARLRPATGHGRWNCPRACLGRWGHETKVPRGAFLGVRSLSLLGHGLLYPLDEVEVQGSSGQSVCRLSIRPLVLIPLVPTSSQQPQVARWQRLCWDSSIPLSTSPPSLLSTKSRGPQLPGPSLGSGPGDQLPAALQGVLSWKTTWGSPPGLPRAPAWRWADLGLWNRLKRSCRPWCGCVAFLNAARLCWGAVGGAASSVLVPGGAVLSLDTPSATPASPDLTTEVTNVAAPSTPLQEQCCGIEHRVLGTACARVCVHVCVTPMSPVWPWARPLHLWFSVISFWTPVDLAPADTLVHL